MGAVRGREGLLRALGRDRSRISSRKALKASRSGLRALRSKEGIDAADDDGGSEGTGKERNGVKADAGQGEHGGRGDGGSVSPR